MPPLQSFSENINSKTLMPRRRAAALPRFLCLFLISVVLLQFS
jgi:hypothetical protein